MIVNLLSIYLLSIGAPGDPVRAAPLPSNKPVVLQTTISKYDGLKRMVSMPVGRREDIGVGDRCWVLRDGHIGGWGTIFFVTEAESVARLAGRTSGIETGWSAVVIRESGLSSLRDQLPDLVTLAGELTRLPPSRKTAWLNLGHLAGLAMDDSLLIRRNGIPIAKGRVALLEDDIALTTLQPLVGNAIPQSHDHIELWPAPSLKKLGRINTTVLAVQPDPEGALITMAGSASDGIAVGRLVDIYRGDKYVGVASVTDLAAPLSTAQLIEAASPQAPQVGDRVLVRPGPTPPPRPLSAAVFRITSDQYCLVAAGESDGIKVGDKFVVRRSDSQVPPRLIDIAELTVRTVKVEHCGAEVKLLGDGRSPLMTWDFADRMDLPETRWGAIGVVTRVEADSRSALADVEARSGLVRGQVVRWVPGNREESKEDRADHPYGAAIILEQLTDQAILYVPPGWGDVGGLDHASIEVPIKSDAKQ